MSRTARTYRLRRLLSRRVLYLIVLPTERCQLRCTYCYQERRRGRMRPEIVLGLERWLARRADELRLMVLEWFGGEPLLAADIVERVQAFAGGLARDRPRLAVRGMMTTNGVLLDSDRLRRLTKAGVRSFQIALDGPAEVHDRFRVAANGGGSFDRIWTNLVAARDSSLDFDICLRLHISEASADTMPEFLLLLGETFGEDPRFRTALCALHEPGLRSNRCAPLLAKEKQRDVLEELAESVECAGLVLATDPYSGSQPKEGCYAAAAGSFVVRPDGELAKCTLALGHPENRVGRLRHDGRVELDSEKVQVWLRGIESGSRQELQCPAIGPVFAPRVTRAGGHDREVHLEACGRT